MTIEQQTTSTTTTVEKTEETKSGLFANRYVKWGLGAVGVAAVGVGIYFAVRHFTSDKEPTEVIGDALENAADAIKS